MRTRVTSGAVLGLLLVAIASCADPAAPEAQCTTTHHDLLDVAADTVIKDAITIEFCIEPRKPGVWLPSTHGADH